MVVLVKLDMMQSRATFLDPWIEMGVHLEQRVMLQGRVQEDAEKGYSGIPQTFPVLLRRDGDN